MKWMTVCTRSTKITNAAQHHLLSFTPPVIGAALECVFGFSCPLPVFNTSAPALCSLVIVHTDFSWQNKQQDRITFSLSLVFFCLVLHTHRMWMFQVDVICVVGAIRCMYSVFWVLSEIDCLNFSLSVPFSLGLSICLFLFLSVWLCLCLSLSFAIGLSLRILVCLFVCLSILPVSLSPACLFVCLHDCLCILYVCLSLLSVCLFFSLSVSLSLCVSVCLFVRLSHMDTERTCEIAAVPPCRPLQDAEHLEIYWNTYTVASCSYRKYNVRKQERGVSHLIAGNKGSKQYRWQAE